MAACVNDWLKNRSRVNEIREDRRQWAPAFAGRDRWAPRSSLVRVAPSAEFDCVSSGFSVRTQHPGSGTIRWTTGVIALGKTSAAAAADDLKIEEVHNYQV